MVKRFAARIAKRKRKTIDLSSKLGRDLLKMADEKLLAGAKLEEFPLREIKVKDQVRTKFNDASIKELAENIRTNGLIQPLVLHREGKRYVLICGERRYRAMGTIKEMDTCPCFILEDKTPEELMAIQFSENSSREELHYVDKADGILNYQNATKASERKITTALGISKSEVHRSLLIARLSKRIKEAAKQFNIEKYVLLEFDALNKGSLKNELEEKIVRGEVTGRTGLRKEVKKSQNKHEVSSLKRPKKRPVVPSGVSANAFLKAMNLKTKEMKLDSQTKAVLNKLVKGNRANDG